MRCAKHAFGSDEIIYGEGGTIMGKSRVWLRGLSLMILSASLHGPSRAQQTHSSNLTTLGPGLNLMPVPANAQMRSGSLKIQAPFYVWETGHSDARLTAALQRFLDRLAKQTGLLMPPVGAPIGGRVTLTVHVDHDSKPVQELGEDE